MKVLTALLNDMMASPDLCREVDIKMEQIATFRREKWKINLKLKRSESVWNRYGMRYDCSLVQVPFQTELRVWNRDQEETCGVLWSRSTSKKGNAEHACRRTGQWVCDGVIV